MALKRAAKEGPVPSPVLIADDPELLRAGTGAMLASEPALDVVGESHDGGEAIEVCNRVRPDLMLMNLPMPRMDSMPPTGRYWPSSPILASWCSAPSQPKGVSKDFAPEATAQFVRVYSRWRWTSGRA